MFNHPAPAHDDAGRKRALQVWEQRVQTVMASSPKSPPAPRAQEKKLKTG
jgi:hypothetical protein